MIQTTVHRRYKHEAETAINDLLNRGFEIIYPLTEIKSDSVNLGSYDYHKSHFIRVKASVSSCWIAKLRRESS
jgi:hypothetical protein